MLKMVFTFNKLDPKTRFSLCPFLRVDCHTIFLCVERKKQGLNLTLSREKRIVLTLLLTISFTYNINSYSSPS
jgi:hypothetical protein